MYTNRSKSFIVVFLTVFSLALFNVGGVTAKAGNASKVVKQAINKGKTDFGYYSIENLTEKVSAKELREYLEPKNYVVLNCIEDFYGNVESAQFVPQIDFFMAFFKRVSGADFFKSSKCKASLFVEERHKTYPVVREIYWSGEVIRGYAHGKGWGLNLSHLKRYKDGSADGFFFCFEAEYYYGIPVSEVKTYYVEMKNAANFRNIEPQIDEKQAPEFFLVTYKDKLEPAMLENFMAGYSNSELQEYRKLASEVGTIVQNYKEYAEDFVLNGKFPELSQEICCYNQYAPFTAPRKSVLVACWPPQQAVRKKLEAFKNFEGIDMARMDEQQKALFLSEQKPLLESVNRALKYMDLLDGMALLSPINVEQAKKSTNVTTVNLLGYAEIDRSNYKGVLDNAIRIADELKNESSGTLSEKYALIGPKIDNAYMAVTNKRNEVFAELSRRNEAAKRNLASSNSSGASSSSSREAEWKKLHGNDAGRYILDKIKDPGRWSGGRTVDSDDDFKDDRTVTFNDGKEVVVFWEHRVKQGVNRYGFSPGVLKSSKWYNDFENAVIGAYLYKYDNGHEWHQGRQ